MISRHHFLARIVSSTVLIALTGCGKSASQSAAEMAVAAATGGKVQVSQSGDHTQMTIKDDKGNVSQINAGGNITLPAGFPSDVHLPSSYTIKTAVTLPQGVILELHTPATMQSTYADYDSTMKSGGWTEAMAMQSSDKESVLTFQKDKRSVIVSIVTSSNAGGGADVHLQSTAEQK